MLQGEASATDLSAIFHPRSIAILGASRSPEKISGRPIALLKAIGFGGSVYPVNPSAERVQGHTAFPSLAELPESPDLAVIALPKARVLAGLEDCAERGVKAAVLFTSGFREDGAEGAALEARLAETARRSGMRLLGPNCMGAFDVHARTAATFAQAAGRARRQGGLSIVSQSGAVASYLLTAANERCIGVAKWVATGNEADVSVADCIDYMAGDAHTRVIAAYLEGVPDGRRLLRALARAHAMSKQVVLVKVGRSARGAKAVGTHTGALVGDDLVFDAAIAERGAIRVETFDEVLDVAALCADAEHLRRDRRLALASISGGAGIMMADAADGTALSLPEPDAEAADRIKAVLPGASAGNPVDTTARIIEDFGALTEVLEALAGTGRFDCIVTFLGTVGHSETGTGAVIEAATSAAMAQVRNVLVLHTNAANAVRFSDAGLCVIPDPVRAIRALGSVAGAASTREAPPPRDHLRVAVPAAPLTERSAKALLAEAGVPAPAEIVARTPVEAAEAQRTIGAPVAMKLLSPDIAHKSDIGAVVLGVSSPEAAGAAFDRIVRAAQDAVPSARIDGVFVSPMIAPVAELIVGAVTDPTFGPVVMVGLGGVFAEIAKDTRIALAPVEPEEALALIRSLDGFALLDGARGRPRGDVAAAARAVSALSHFAVANADWVASCEVNPLAVLPEGAVALDALIERHPDLRSETLDLTSAA